VRFIQSIISMFLLILLMKPEITYCCTAFCLAQGNHVLVGKNLDWFVDDGIVVINQKNIFKSVFFQNSESPLQWTSKYGSVTFNQFGKEFPLGGMNEAGLVIEELSYSSSRYPPPDDRPAINELQWIQYNLDIHQTVEEVIENASMIRISRFFTSLHYFITDRSGQAAVIEYIDGNLKVYTGNRLPVPALSNNRYDNLLRYLKMHRGFGGSMEVHPGAGSQERFVLVATFLQNQQQEKIGISVNRALDLLNSVKQNDTQWQIVYDLINLSVHFRTRSDSSIREIKFLDLDFKCTTTPQFSDMKVKAEKGNQIMLESYNTSRNQELLRLVFTQLMQFGEIEEFPSKTLIKLSKYPDSCICLETH